MDDADEVRAETLIRENSIYLKVIGGLGTLVLLMVGGFLSFWINSIADKFTTQQSQLSRQWDVLNQRAERLSTLENRLANNDALTADHEKQLRTLEHDHTRMKNRLKMED